MLHEEKKRSEDLQFSVEEAKISSEEQNVSIDWTFTYLITQLFFYYHRHKQIFDSIFSKFYIKITINLGSHLEKVRRFQ